MTAIVTPGHLSGHVTWDNDAWTLNANGSQASLTVSGEETSAKLTASVGGSGFYGGLSASVNFHICDHPHPLNLDIWLSSSEKSPLTLKHANKTTLKIENGNNVYAYDNPRIEIKWHHENTWYTLANDNQFNWTATVAGYFDLRGVVTYNYTEYTTPNFNIEVQFPHKDKILSDGNIVTSMDACWLSTINFTKNNPHLRREEGFYIMLDTAANTYVIKNFDYGKPVSNDVNIVSWYSPIPDKEIPSNPTPLDKPEYLVASFHTHPPRTYVTYPAETMVAGPSMPDLGFSWSLQIPGFVYDYDVPYNILPPNHNIDLKGMIFCAPPYQRPTP